MAAKILMNSNVVTPEPNRDLSTFCWSVSLILLSFLCLTQFFVLLCFSIIWYGSVVSSLLVSTHTWWAWYGPQLWWLPILAIVGGFAIPGRRVTRWITFGLAAILLTDASLVAISHFRWEVEATRTTNEQMALLRQKSDVEIDFQYFREPFGEQLRTAGVTFHAARQLQCANPMELMSVAHGYPGAVRVCIHER
jgi:hypothetical protein